MTPIKGHFTQYQKLVISKRLSLGDGRVVEAVGQLNMKFKVSDTKRAVYMTSSMFQI